MAKAKQEERRKYPRPEGEKAHSEEEREKRRKMALKLKDALRYADSTPATKKQKTFDEEIAEFLGVGEE